MNSQQALELICNGIGEMFSCSFPCICGKNPLAGELNEEDEHNLSLLLEHISNFKKMVPARCDLLSKVVLLEGKTNNLCIYDRLEHFVIVDHSVTLGGHKELVRLGQHIAYLLSVPFIEIKEA